MQYNTIQYNSIVFSTHVLWTLGWFGNIFKECLSDTRNFLQGLVPKKSCTHFFVFNFFYLLNFREREREIFVCCFTDLCIHWLMLTGDQTATSVCQNNAGPTEIPHRAPIFLFDLVSSSPSIFPGSPGSHFLLRYISSPMLANPKQCRKPTGGLKLHIKKKRHLLLKGTLTTT